MPLIGTVKVDRFEVNSVFDIVVAKSLALPDTRSPFENTLIVFLEIGYIVTKENVFMSVKNVG